MNLQIKSMFYIYIMKRERPQHELIETLHIWMAKVNIVKEELSKVQQIIKDIEEKIAELN